MPPIDKDSTEVFVKGSGSRACVVGNEQCRLDEHALKRYIEKHVRDTKPKVDYWRLAGMVVPIIVMFSIWLISVEKRVSIVEIKLSEIVEMRNAINEIQRDVNDIKGRIIRIETRSTP